MMRLVNIVFDLVEVAFVVIVVIAVNKGLL